MGTDLKSFGQIGTPFAIPSDAIQDGGKEGEKLANLTPYDVEASKDGKVYKMTDKSEPDPRDPEKSKTMYGNVTRKGGKHYYLRKDQFQNLALFPKLPAQPGGMGGPGGGLPPM